LLNTILGSFSTGVAPVTSSYESIATVTVGSGGTSSISFTSIPATYTHLQIRAIVRSNRTGGDDDSLVLQFNSDSGSNYSYHYIFGNGAGVGASSATSQTKIIGMNAIPATGSRATGIFGASILDVLDYANTNKYKTCRTLGNFDSNGGGQAALISGLWMSTSAITSITYTVLDGTGFEQYTHFALYGIKGA
jgi:hypothetical protein